MVKHGTTLLVIIARRLHGTVFCNWKKSESVVNMSAEVPVTANAFEAIQNIDTGRLSALSERELRPILSCLVRMSLCSPLDTSDKWGERRKEILRCLAGIETVNSLVGLLSIDFHALEQDAKKEQQLR